MRIKISWPSGHVMGELNDSPTASALGQILPVNGSANTWGEEVYFTVPIEAEVSPTAEDVVDPGTICYWVEGKAIALPYGRTPASEGDECRLVAPVNIIGKIEGDPDMLSGISAGHPITMEKAD